MKLSMRQTLGHVPLQFLPFVSLNSISWKRRFMSLCFGWLWWSWDLWTRQNDPVNPKQRIS